MSPTVQRATTDTQLEGSTKWRPPTTSPETTSNSGNSVEDEIKNLDSDDSVERFFQRVDQNLRGPDPDHLSC